MQLEKGSQGRSLYGFRFFNLHCRDLTDTDATMTDSHPEATDDRLYMSQQYTGKTIDDVYSMLVSCRNCLLLLCFIVFIFEAHKLLKNAMKRHFKA